AGAEVLPERRVVGVVDRLAAGQAGQCDPGETQLVEGAPRLLDRDVGVVERHRREAGEAAAVAGPRVDVDVVDVAGRGAGAGAVGDLGVEPDRGEHRDVDAGGVHRREPVVEV